MFTVKQILKGMFNGYSGVIFSISTGLCPDCYAHMKTIKMNKGYFYSICMKCGYDYEIRDCKKPRSAVVAAGDLLEMEKV